MDFQPSNAPTAVGFSIEAVDGSDEVDVTVTVVIRMSAEMAERYAEHFRQATHHARGTVVPPSNEVEEWRRKHDQT